MDKYIYYSVGTNHDGHDDVAIVEDKTIESAIKQFLAYYTNASSKNVQKIDLYRKNFVQGIQIISDY